MDVPLLRKLTEKSPMKFGQYSDSTVGDLLNAGKNQYLRWVYYNQGGITFTDNILEQIKIPERYYISKPGKNPEMLEEVDREVFGKLYGVQKIIAKNSQHKRNQARAIAHRMPDNLAHTKAAMQRKNQGH